MHGENLKLRLVLVDVITRADTM